MGLMKMLCIFCTIIYPTDRKELRSTIALVIGWNLILEYAIGTASVARAYSSYLDHLLGNVMSQAFKENIPLGLGDYFSPYVDMCAFSITIFLTIILR